MSVFRSRNLLKAAGLFLYAAAASLIFSGHASAQFAFGGDAPIEVDADRIEYEGGIAVLSGQVQIVQSDVRILADQVNLYRAELGSGQLGDVTKIEAVGNFYYITPLEKVRGDRGVYEQSLGRITVTGDVILEDSNGSIGTGNSLIYNVGTKEALLQSECQGRKCADRVKLLIDNNGNR